MKKSRDIPYQTAKESIVSSGVLVRELTNSLLIHRLLVNPWVQLQRRCSKKARILPWKKRSSLSPLLVLHSLVRAHRSLPSASDSLKWCSI